jgi:hypothetical protein
MASKGSNERRNDDEPKDLTCLYIAWYQRSVRLVTNRTLIIQHKEKNHGD